jgi:hypothetical protein
MTSRAALPLSDDVEADLAPALSLDDIEPEPHFLRSQGR